jgi:hypothetical protein
MPLLVPQVLASDDPLPPVCDLLQSHQVLLVNFFEALGRIPQVFQWFPGIVLRPITLPLDEVLQALLPFVEVC